MEVSFNVNPDTTIEELVERKPAAIRYLSDKGIRCIICGEPVWGTLASAARGKGFSDDEILGFAEELNRLDG